MKTKILILIITILALTSCRKYDEGGFYVLSNMSKKIAGTYHFTHYYIDGVDSADYYFNNDYTAYCNLQYDKEHDARGYILDYKYKDTYYDTLSFRIYGNNWQWNNKKNTEIIINSGDIEFHASSFDTVIHSGPFSPNTIVVWNILKLKRGELILETNYNNKLYRAELR